ncbi:MAG: hypothetical protein AAF743_12190, partial [Planctomycetota bacterium]
MHVALSKSPTQAAAIPPIANPRPLRRGSADADVARIPKIPQMNAVIARATPTQGMMLSKPVTSEVTAVPDMPVGAAGVRSPGDGYC